MYEEDKDLLLETLQQHKRTAIGGAAILLTLLLLLFGWEGPETSAGNVEGADSRARPEMELEEKSETARSEEPGSAKKAQPADKQEHFRTGQRIRGAEKAALGEALADPFSMRHETREEARNRLSHPAPPAPAENPAPTAAKPPEMRKDDAPKPAEPVCLQGIVTGERGSVAILQKGEKSYALTVGERLEGRTVAAIGKKEVQFADGETLILQLP